MILKYDIKSLYIVSRRHPFEPSKGEIKKSNSSPQKKMKKTTKCWPFYDV
jgi:hypothetical protein